MKTVKKMKLHDGIVALLMLMLGIVLLVWPDTTQQMIGKVIGGGLFLFGAMQLILTLIKRDWNIISQGSILLSIIIAVIGGWIYLKPTWILGMIPLILGVVIILNGLHNVAKALQLKKVGYGRWWIAVILGLLTIILGGILINIRDTAIQTVIRIIGAFLIYDAVSDLWIVITMYRAVKELNVVGKEEEAIDVEGIEVDGEQGR